MNRQGGGYPSGKENHAQKKKNPAGEFPERESLRGKRAKKNTRRGGGGVNQGGDESRAR